MLPCRAVGRILQFVLALILGLALVTWIASGIVDQTTREWFEKDVNMRAELVVNGARRVLISHWRVWAGRMLVDAARLRSRDRITGRLADHVAVATGSG